MSLNKKLSDALNEQINEEMWSSNLYLSMSIYFDKMGLSGCAHWMKKQAEEELGHAHKIIEWSVKRGGEPEVGQINVVPTGWGSPLEVFEHVYKHEVHVSESIDKLVDIASAEKDKATQDFLWGFVREQVEEEESAQKIIAKFKLMGEKNIVFLDMELGKR
ncbi:MAG: ferritin [Massilibacteroides sp.]|nr:ferritin [Massilibacteroides sp.]MDD3061954.1 ferritin [Massilibacteroides sp.]MDD4114983.1 ferritin [Massilibacteroides sp.]